MRFIGNKENLLDTIFATLLSYGVGGESFCDLFSGTTSVARYFKKRGYSVISCDLLYMSYCLQRAYIENDSIPTFSNLLPVIKQATNSGLFCDPLSKVVEYLNRIAPIQGFVYNNYTPCGTQNLSQPRMYFTSENGAAIDAIRTQTEDWYKNNLISEQEYFILLSCIIETVPYYANIAGVYAAFHKKWDSRALKQFSLRPIEIISNGKTNRSYNMDSTLLCQNINVDILYLDPPYNERQYAPNYHVLETIAKYDNPTIHGVTGLRDYSKQKSMFCNLNGALEGLNHIAKTAHYKYLAMSYSSDGIMSHHQIVDLLSYYGDVSSVDFNYTRYKSNSSGNGGKNVIEKLYILKR